MKLLMSMVAAMAAMAQAVTCPAGSLEGSTPATGCICPSGASGTSSGGACVPFDLASAPYTGVCTGDVLPKASNMTTSLANMQLTTINMTGTDTLVRFTISIPMMADRNYTEVGVTGPAVDAVKTSCVAGQVFTSFTTVGPSANCVENWNITVDFDKLRTCGFAISSANNLTTGYQLFDGNIRVKFVEPVEVGTGGFAQNVTRSVTVDYPVRIAFDSNYVVPMTVNDVTVYARQQVDFAITGQNIPKDPVLNGQPNATITYTIQYPYAIRAWGTVTGNTNIPATVSALGSVCANTTSYSVSDTASTATCVKSDNYLMFTVTNQSDPLQCKFTSYQYILPFIVGCGTNSGSNITAADCPIAADDTSGNVTFSVTSENFCTATAATDNINGVISITSFKGVSVTDYSTQQNAWRWGDKIFMRMDFAGLPLRTCHLTKLERFYDNNTISSVSSWTEVGTAGTVSVNDGNATTSITIGSPNTFSDSGAIPATPQLNVAPTVATGNLGLQDDGKQYRFVLVANDDLLGSSSEPQRGADKFLKLRATIDVTYDRQRRRRRQTAAGGSGVKESETQQIAAPEPSTATAAPNSAVRAAPVVALVLAVLSAVALL